MKGGMAGSTEGLDSKDISPTHQFSNYCCKLVQNLGDLPSSSREHTEQAKEQENTLYSKSVYLMTEAKQF